MAYLTIHHLDGDAAALLQRKQSHFDPTVRDFAGHYGALFSVTAPTEQGLVVVNVWTSREAAARFTQLPEIQKAQQLSGLPLPSRFERYPEALLEEYQR